MISRPCSTAPACDGRSCFTVLMRRSGRLSPLPINGNGRPGLGSRTASISPTALSHPAMQRWWPPRSRSTQIAPRVGMLTRSGMAFLRIVIPLYLLFEHDLFGKPVPTFPDHALARGHIDHFVAVEHLPSLGSVEVAFPGGDDDGGDAIADQIAERARHADEPVDREH